jgi:hypothetical protein
MLGKGHDRIAVWRERFIQRRSRLSLGIDHAHAVALHGRHHGQRADLP